MSIEQWWSKLRPSTREWLIENNGDAVPPEIVAEITAAGGSITSNAWREGRRLDRSDHQRRRPRNANRIELAGSVTGQSQQDAVKSVMVPSYIGRD